MKKQDANYTDTLELSGSATPWNRLPDWLRQRARLSPDRPALFHARGCWTFAELDRDVSAMARALAAAGVTSGQKVALLAQDPLRSTAAFHAVPRLGATIAPLHRRATPDQLAATVGDCQARVLLHDEPNAITADRIRARFSGLRALALEDLGGGRAPAAGNNADVELEWIAPTAAHSVVYTSGTSGAPKGAVLTAGNYLWSAVGTALRLGVNADDRWLACLPLYHVGGLAILVRSAVCGCAVVLREHFDAAAVNRDIDALGVTIVSVVSTMLVRMLEARGRTPYPNTLRCVLVGGGAVPAPLLADCAARSVPIVQTYGLTEAASQVTTLSPGEALERLGSAGRPLFPTEIRIADPHGRALPAGTTGEILVRGPTVTPGYINRPEETAAAFRGGWLRTGDVGHVDPHGYLYPHGRMDDLIVSGGENISPLEIERVLCTHPAVRDAGVAGVRDAHWGERVVATVTLHPGASTTEAELLAFCYRRLPSHQVPKRVRFADVLPRTASGKLMRRALREESD